MVTENPPEYSSNKVELGTADGKITNISLYTGHAEVTRLFKPKVSPGQNKVVISGFASNLNESTVRYVRGL